MCQERVIAVLRGCVKEGQKMHTGISRMEIVGDADKSTSNGVVGMDT